MLEQADRDFAPWAQHGLAPEEAAMAKNHCRHMGEMCFVATVSADARRGRPFTAGGVQDVCRLYTV